MPTWRIANNLTVVGSGADHIEAEYFKVTDDGRFIEFKDNDHKVVYMVNAGHVVSVTRDDS
jgi:hypothetical protein